MKVVIRQAEEDDIESICSFDQIALESQDRRDFIARSVQSGICCVADVNGKAIGYVVLDYNFYSNGMIEMLYIGSEYRRRSIGTKLVEHVESICKTEKLFTSTNQSNLPMQELLNKLGYERSGFIDNLDEGDPEIVYFKRVQ